MCIRDSPRTLCGEAPGDHGTCHHGGSCHSEQGQGEQSSADKQIGGLGSAETLSCLQELGIGVKDAGVKSGGGSEGGAELAECEIQ
eukprot:7966030-Prorocentrum_lima.AAC.1